jgi:hypothetical protein
LSDPLAEIGSMILCARIVGLLVGVTAVYILTRSLQTSLQNAIAPFFSVMLCTTTSILLLESFIDTKPDGLMVGLLMVALGQYALLVLRGFTLTRALALSGFWVASLSCKELSGATMALPVLFLLVQAATMWKRQQKQAKYLLIGILSAVPFYLLFNVVYAPHAWLGRMAYVLGPLKDPAIWANASQTDASYMRDTVQAIASALGIGGVLALVLTVLGSFRYPSPKLFLLWLPFVSHLLLTTLSAGYMPAYFMLPLGAALTLPSSYVFTQILQGQREQHDATRRILALAACTVLICLWSGCSATVLFRETHREALEQRWASANVPSSETISVVTLVPTSTEATTLANSGFRVDKRPLFQLMEGPIAERPNFLLLPNDVQNWIQGIRQRPARAALLWRLTGFDYRRFRSFEDLGYRRIADAAPELPAWCVPLLVAGGSRYLQTRLMVYRLDATAPQ